MKDLKEFGVQEMKQEDLKRVEGGMKWWKALLGFAVFLAIGLIATGGDGHF